ncbi:MAG TPA: site-specific DNA-methyltransferase [Chlorobaculum sp.]|uniref:Uncharacterized protein n=1 Tax=Chlorobaculum tepidum (strain ATCC 49652 / DSM 12025 / NBRC 103806 / TLS) TaxID=194439 RepID=Q8KAD6_CHLTE|nr:hypothetical protein CT2227 [Chlorobaculum tepidum TLS]HBU23178.1 site-specific DNA-methyltransferase [Chlorobaculum sp.]
MKTTHTIIHGDSRQMNLLPDRSVHLVVTSPFCWQIKGYCCECERYLIFFPLGTRA